MNMFQMGSYKTATWITVAVSFVGFSMLIGGAILTGLAYTELRPNFADENYYRYMGAHLQKTVGPVMLAFGGLLLLSGCAFFGFVILATQNRSNSKESAKLRARRDVY